MARPKKDNADYFSHDADMRNDPKIKALRRKFGLEGYALWCFILEVLTDSDFFQFEWSDLQIELLSGDFDCDPETLKSVIDYCTNTLKLFTIENDILSSYQHRKRFDSLLSKRNRQNKRSKSVVIDSENPYSKVKDSIVKESKEDDIIVDDLIPKNKFSIFTDEEYLKGVQSHYESCYFIKIPMDVLKDEGKKFVSSRLTATDTSRPQYEYASYFQNILKNIAEKMKNDEPKTTKPKKTQYVEIHATKGDHCEGRDIRRTSLDKIKSEYEQQGCTVEIMREYER